MAAKDIINAKLDQISWWWQQRLMNQFLSETQYHHYCYRCGGIMHYGVRCYPTYNAETGQPHGVELMVKCENYPGPNYNHDGFTKFMLRSPFLLDYLRKNPYILGVQTVLDVYQDPF